MSIDKSIFSICLMFIVCSVGFAQSYEQNPTLHQWTIKDKKYNDCKTGNPVLPGYYADPTIIEHDGTFYIYATSDLMSWNDISRLGVWSSTDLKNWKCTYLNWPRKELCVSETGRPDGVWAPSVVKAPNGKFYMYVTVGREIWVGVAEHPLGPWKNAKSDNQPLIRHKEFYYVETIDAECFIDDDGSAYLYWGSSDSGFSIEGRCLAVKLNSDMISFDCEPQDVTPPYYFEAPYMYKHNGKYYFMYSFGKTWDKTYQVRYAIGETPLGPWTEGKVRPILVANEKDERIASTGHHTMLRYQGKHYIVYHRFNTMKNFDIAGNLRQVAIDELKINDKGEMEHVLTTQKGTLPILSSKKTNLAFGAKISASSMIDSICRPEYAVDENNGTLWAGKNQDDWLMIDLGRDTAFSTVEIYVEYPIYAYSYSIETSSDNKVWAVIDDKFENVELGSPMIFSGKQKARYIRIRMKTPGRVPFRPGIWEVKIY